MKRLAVPASVSPALRLTLAATTGLRRHLEACAPEEGCGVLLGRADEATRFVPMRNTASEPRRAFAFDDAQWLRVAREADAADLEVLGVAHSHVDCAAEPSGLDRTFAGAVRWLVIVEVRRGEALALRAWRCSGAALREAAVEVA